MKAIPTLIATGLALGAHAQSWQALGLTSIPNESATCIGIHQGVLYTNNFTGGLRKSYDNGDSWTAVPTNGVVGSPTGFASTGNRLYMSSQDASASGYIYWSTDEGNTWTVDTAGMPPHAWISGGKAAVGELLGYNGHLALIADQANAYYVKAESDASWQQVPWLIDNDPGSFWNIGDTLLMHGAGAQSHGFAYSTDHGQTWVTPPCTGLPAWYSGGILTHDPITGRIYSVGGVYNILAPLLHYSDDFGNTWTAIDLVPFLEVGATVWDFSHDVVSLLARGTHIWLSCTNSQVNTRPDLFLSTDGGTTFARDTVGLPVDPYGTYQMRSLMEKDGEVFCVANLNDVFRRTLGPTGIGDASEVPLLTVWPNPATDRVQVDARMRTGVRFQVRDAQGREVLQGMLSTDGVIQLGTLGGGTYELLLYEGMRVVGRQRLVKQ